MKKVLFLCSMSLLTCFPADAGRRRSDHRPLRYIIWNGYADNLGRNARLRFPLDEKSQLTGEIIDLNSNTSTTFQPHRARMKKSSQSFNKMKQPTTVGEAAEPVFPLDTPPPIVQIQVGKTTDPFSLTTFYNGAQLRWQYDQIPLLSRMWLNNIDYSDWREPPARSQLP
ncbi:MAG: hypothetical protein LBQ08_00645 [Holosporaceae bacterium]|jgi:hypothetical protein|nr:hypothetical protein [Holosporaceae bacterium]